MSISTISLVESLLQHDRPSAWWGLDTADPTAEDSGNGYTLTAIGAPANNATLHRAACDNGASGARDFNGTTDGYFTLGTVTDVPEGPPPFHAASSGTAATNTGSVISPGGIQVGDLLLVVGVHTTNGATITTAPAGYTIVNTALSVGNHTLVCYRKTAVLADCVQQQVQIVWNSAAATATIMLVYRGLDTTVANLIFDSNRQATASATFHSTTTETHPDGARQLVIWTKDAATTIVPEQTRVNSRITVDNGNLSIMAVDYEKETAGSGFQVATTGVATTLGAFLITFGAPRKVLNSELDDLAATITIGCLVSFDAFTSERTIVRKYQSWGLVASAAGVLQFLYRDGGGADRTINGPTLSLATTYRIWVVDDGTDIHFYVNGTKTTTARTGTAGYTTNANRVSIAHVFDGATASAHTNGRIDELAIFSAPFSQQMVMTHETAATVGTFGDYIQAAGARFPRAKLELAMTSKPTALCYSYSDVTAHLRHDAGLQIQHLRNDPLDRIEAGTMSFVLNNRGATGVAPPYDDLTPRRAVRFRAQVTTDGPVIPRFFGYTESPKYGRPHMGKDSTVSLTATDVFKTLSLNKIRDTFVRPDEYAHERLDALLADVPGLKRLIDEGVHKMIGDDLQGVARLEHAQAIAESDGGIFFADAQGRAVFQSNQYRSINERTVRATYGWPGTTAPYPCKFFEPEVDESRIYTAAAVTPASGNVQRAISAIAENGDDLEITKEVSTLHALDADADAMAHHIVNAYSIPRDRVPALVLQPNAFSSPLTMWATVLAHEISHRIKTVEKPIGATSETGREHFIEGISESVNVNDWTVTFSLSPAELEGNYFVIGTSRIEDGSVISW